MLAGCGTMCTVQSELQADPFNFVGLHQRTCVGAFASYQKHRDETEFRLSASPNIIKLSLVYFCVLFKQNSQRKAFHSFIHLSV